MGEAAPAVLRPGGEAARESAASKPVTPTAWAQAAGRPRRGARRWRAQGEQGQREGEPGWGLLGAAPLALEHRGHQCASRIQLGGALEAVETKSITELSLVFGFTWMVPTIVVFFVLLMASSTGSSPGAIKRD